MASDPNNLFAIRTDPIGKIAQSIDQLLAVNIAIAANLQQLIQVLAAEKQVIRGPDGVIVGTRTMLQQQNT